jgi:hypothetical protein
MNIPIILLACLLGIIINLSFSGSLIQPDWALALLTAAVLTHRGSWIWVAIATCFHDLIFHWSPLVSLPWILASPFIIAWSDAQIGPNLLQRFFAMLMVISSLLWAEWGVIACLLTLLLCIAFWFIMVRFYAQPA